MPKVPVLNMRVMDVFEDTCCSETDALSPVPDTPFLKCGFCGRQWVRVGDKKRLTLLCEKGEIEVPDQPEEKRP